jgi:uncharacterized DUF497 family protein
LDNFDYDITFQSLRDIRLVIKFSWDARKEAPNLAKHGVSFSEAELAFSDPLSIVAFDETHSPVGKAELRWWLLGKVETRIMLIRYTHRPNGVIRTIGAGYWEIGAKLYEEKNETR